LGQTQIPVFPLHGNFCKTELVLSIGLLGASPQTPRGSASRKDWGPIPSAKQNNAFCLFFREKKKWRKLLVVFIDLFGGKLQTPWFASRKGWDPLLSAKQNNAFCFFFRKKKKWRKLLVVFIGLLGASPQTPVVPLRGRIGVLYLLRSRTTLFASFSGKRRDILDQFFSLVGILDFDALLADGRLKLI
jgi:hypothetical protein